MVTNSAKHQLLVLLGIFLLSLAAFLAVNFGYRYGIKILLGTGYVALVASIVAGGVLIIINIIRTVRRWMRNGM